MFIYQMLLSRKVILFVIKFLFLSYCSQTLYASGARKFIFPNIGPIGCVPFVLADGKLPFRKCNAEINNGIKTYNQFLKSTLISLAANLPGANIVYANVYTRGFYAATRPKTYGESLCTCSKEFTECYIPCLSNSLLA